MIDSVDHAWTVRADEADVIAVDPMHAGHVRKLPPTRAPIGSHRAVGAPLQIGSIGNDAAGIIAGKARTGPEKDRASKRLAGRTGQQESERHNEPQTSTHFQFSALQPTDTSLEACSRNEKPATASSHKRRAWPHYHMARQAIAAASPRS